MQHIIRTMLNSHPVRSQAGVTAIEYGLIAALIAVVIIGGITLIGGNLATTFTSISNSI